MIIGILSILTVACKKENDNNSTSSTPKTVTDIDGNVYHTVTIGTQVWMAENLKVIKFNDGTAIPMVTNSKTWMNLSTPGYCWPNNDVATYKNTSGALYNWHTVNSGLLCPIGWHVPTDAEWTILITYLGGESVAGGKLKEVGTSHWTNPNSGATNETGFTALPGLSRSYGGDYFFIASNSSAGGWWSSSNANTNDADRAWYRSIFNDYDGVERKMGQQQAGLSVRCVKD